MVARSILPCVLIYKVQQHQQTNGIRAKLVPQSSCAIWKRFVVLGQHGAHLWPKKCGVAISSSPSVERPLFHRSSDVAMVRSLVPRFRTYLADVCSPVAYRQPVPVRNRKQNTARSRNRGFARPSAQIICLPLASSASFAPTIESRHAYQCKGRKTREEDRPRPRGPVRISTRQETSSTAPPFHMEGWTWFHCVMRRSGASIAGTDTDAGRKAGIVSLAIETANAAPNRTRDKPDISAPCPAIEPASASFPLHPSSGISGQHALEERGLQQAGELVIRGCELDFEIAEIGMNRRSRERLLFDFRSGHLANGDGCVEDRGERCGDEVVARLDVQIEPHSVLKVHPYRHD